LEPSGAEFVISHTSCVPKICDYPTYLIVHEPPSRFLKNEVYLKNLMTYDGYFTISDSVRQFLRDLTFGIGRPDPIGFFYTTAQRSELGAHLPEIVKQGKLQIVYIGTNWDRRAPQLFEILDNKGILRIHGPTHSWPTGLRSYAGPLPFNGNGPQKSLNETGYDVIAHDPTASGPARTVLGNAARLVPSVRDALAHTDVAVITTPWPEYAEISPGWVANGRTRFIIDCWRQLTPQSFSNQCRIVRLGHQETISAAGKRLAAE
jgi:hypothetical protein